MELNAGKPLRNANTDVIILDGLVDCIFSEGRIPYDDELEDFIKNRLKMDLPVIQYMEIIKRLKRDYREQVGKMDKDLALRDPHNDKLFDLADNIWSTEDFSESEEEIEEESEGPKVEQQLCFSGFGWDDLNALLPIMFKNTVKEGPESLMRSLMLDQHFDDLHATFKNVVKEGPASILRSALVEDVIPLAVLPPLQPSKEDFDTAMSSNEQKLS